MFPKNGNNVQRLDPRDLLMLGNSVLGELCDVYDGTHQTPAYKDNGIMFLSVENIKTLKSEKYISASDFERFSCLP